MTWGDDVAQSPGPTEPKWSQSAPPPWLAGQVLGPFQFPLCQRVKEGWCTGYPMSKVGGCWVGWPSGFVYGRSARVWWVTASNQWWSSLTPPINTPIPPSVRGEIRKWDLAFYSDPKFILCRVERERGEVLRAGRLPDLSGVLWVARALKLCQNPFRFDKIFWALVWSSVRALPEFCEFRQRIDSRVPLVY
jgi:hypothetical protein